MKWPNGGFFLFHSHFNHQQSAIVLRIERPAGSVVQKGDTVLTIESMKMENAIVSPVNGTVAEIRVKQGDPVNAGQELAIIR